MALYLYIQLRKVEAQWGDGLKGMRYQQARKALQELEKLDGQEHIKNWRPQVLLPCICTCVCTCNMHMHMHMHLHMHMHMPCTCHAHLAAAGAAAGQARPAVTDGRAP